MLDKKHITAELQSIFKLINACFDVTALFKLISKSMGFDKAIHQIIEKDYPELKPYVTRDNKKMVFEDVARNISKKITHAPEAELEEITDWVLLYLFFPEALPKKKGVEEYRDKPSILETFSKNLKNKPGVDHNFYGFYTVSLPNAVKAWIALHKYKIEEEKEEKNLTVKPQELPGFQEEELADISDFIEEFINNKTFKKYEEDLKNYVDKQGTDLQKKYIKIKFKNPDISDEKISQILKRPDHVIRDAKKGLISIIGQFAKNLKDEGNSDLFNTMKRKDLLPVNLKESKISSILDYLKGLKSKIAEKEIVNEFENILNNIQASFVKNESYKNSFVLKKRFYDLLKKEGYLEDLISVSKEDYEKEKVDDDFKEGFTFKLKPEVAKDLEKTEKLFKSYKYAEKRLKEAKESLKGYIKKYVKEKYPDTSKEILENLKIYFKEDSNAYSFVITLDEKEIKTNYLEYLETNWFDISGSWNWLVWLSDEDSPFYDSTFVEAYSYDQMTTAMEQFVHTLDEGDFYHELDRGIKKFMAEQLGVTPSLVKR